MRVIIEVNNSEELREALALLGDKPMEVREKRSLRRARLEQLFKRMSGVLPQDYHFDRDELHER